jgi:hypothetical protein
MSVKSSYNWAGKADLSLISQATNVLYVDNKRTDTYTEVGTYNLPFKTIQAALDSITGGTAASRFCIKIATGNPYTENLTISKNYITLEGYGDTILTGNLTFETTAVYVKFRYLKLNGNATGAYTNAFVLDVCDCNTDENKDWVFSCTVGGAFIQIYGQSTMWFADVDFTNITGVVANQGGYFEGTYSFNACRGEFIGFENCDGIVNINAGSEIYVGAAMCIGTTVNVAEGATLHIDAVSASRLATLNNSGTLDLTTTSSAIYYDNTASGLVAETVKAAIDENAASLADIMNYVAVVDNGSDVYPIDMASRQYKNIRIATADADAKEVTVSNVPAGDAELFIELTYTNAAAITWTLKAASTVTWLTGSAPTLTAGKVYYIAALTSDGGATWRCNSIGGW